MYCSTNLNVYANIYKQKMLEALEWRSREGYTS